MVNISGGELCRGVLLGPSSVLTAASCLYAEPNIRDILVIPGIQSANRHKNILSVALWQNALRLGGCGFNFRPSNTKNNKKNILLLASLLGIMGYIYHSGNR